MTATTPTPDTAPTTPTTPTKRAGRPTRPRREPGRAAYSGVVRLGVLDLRRRLRNRVEMFFVVALPGFLYLVFGLGSDDPLGEGTGANVAMYVLISMAAYGAVSATTSVAGSAVLEHASGWGRQLALTPVRAVDLVVVRAVVAMVVAAVPVAVVYTVGAATGARATAGDWALTALVVWLGSAVFALFGVAVSAWFRSESAGGITSGAVVVLAFLGNVFTPASGLVLDIGRFTPFYGYAALARYPVTDGWTASGEHDPLWLPVVNVVAWTLVLATVAVWGVRRGRERA